MPSSCIYHQWIPGPCPWVCEGMVGPLKPHNHHVQFKNASPRPAQHLPVHFLKEKNYLLLRSDPQGNCVTPNSHFLGTS